MRPSKLYKRLGLTGPASQLVNVTAGSLELGDNVHSVTISRGGSDLSSYTPSTITVETPANVPPSESGSYLNVTLDPTAAAAIAAATGETAEDITWRYRGRIATLTAHDKQRHKGDPAAWRGTTMVGAGWGSLYQHAPDTYTPNTHNLVPDPHSLDATQWRASGDHAAVTIDGQGAIRVLKNATGGSLNVDPNTGFPVVPGDRVYVSVEVLVNAPMVARARINTYDGATGETLGDLISQSPADGWVTHTVAATIEGAPGYARTFVITSSALSAGQGFYVRNMSVTKGRPYGTLEHAALTLLRPSWAPFAEVDWNGDTEAWPELPAGESHDPLTAADLISTLSSRLYGLSDDRLGNFRVSALNYMKADAANAAISAWPLARAHVLAPTTWDQPSTYPTEYRITLLDPFGNIDEIITAPGGIPTGETRIVDQDWTEIVQTTDQWRRIHGVRWETFQTAWRLPQIDIRLDHLIASPYEAHRRAAGMLLRLNVADPVALAGDWPGYIDGIHIVTSLEETITPDAWTLTIGLKDYRSLDGGSQFPIKPRTWAQAGTRTWDDAGAATWNEGVPA